MDRLPQELLHVVLTHLEEDRQSLLRCGLVSHRWVFPVRTCLLRTLPFCVGEGEHDFEYLTALQTVLDSTPLLWYYIHNVELQQCLVPILGKLEEKCKTIASILVHVPSPRSLSLSYVEWFFVPACLRSALTKLLRQPTLTAISMDKFTSFPRNDLPSLLSLPSNLMHLHLGEVYESSWNLLVKGQPPREFSNTHKTVQPQSFSLSAPFLHMNWLLAENSPLDLSHLRALKIDFGKMTERSFLFRLFEVVGPTLEKLVITDLWPEDSSLPNSVSINLTPHLRTLMIDTTLWRSYLPWMEKFFRLPPSHRHPLQSLTITLGVHVSLKDDKELVSASTIDFWKSLDRIFSQPCYSSLRDIKVYLKTVPLVLREGYIEALQRAFGRLDYGERRIQVFLLGRI